MLPVGQEALSEWCGLDSWSVKVSGQQLAHWNSMWLTGQVKVCDLASVGIYACLAAFKNNTYTADIAHFSV